MTFTQSTAFAGRTCGQTVRYGRAREQCPHGVLGVIPIPSVLRSLYQCEIFSSSFVVVGGNESRRTVGVVWFLVSRVTARSVQL